MSKISEQVAEFHRATGCAVRGIPTLAVPEKDLREELIREEFYELKEALAEDDIVGVADALADLVYVVVGAAHTFGIPLDEVLDEVHASNMTKIGGTKREDGKVQKTAGYRPPNIEEVLGL